MSPERRPVPNGASLPGRLMATWTVQCAWCQRSIITAGWRTIGEATEEIVRQGWRLCQPTGGWCCPTHAAAPFAPPQEETSNA